MNPLTQSSRIPLKSAFLVLFPSCCTPPTHTFVYKYACVVAKIHIWGRKQETKWNGRRWKQGPTHRFPFLWCRAARGKVSDSWSPWKQSWCSGVWGPGEGALSAPDLGCVAHRMLEDCVILLTLPQHYARNSSGATRATGTYLGTFQKLGSSRARHHQVC